MFLMKLFICLRLFNELVIVYFFEKLFLCMGK